MKQPKPTSVEVPAAAPQPSVQHVQVISLPAQPRPTGVVVE